VIASFKSEASCLKINSTLPPFLKMETSQQEPDPMFRIASLKKQLAWMESQRYDLETTTSSLRAILNLIIGEINTSGGSHKLQVLRDQAERMLRL